MIPFPTEGHDDLARWETLRRVLVYEHPPWIRLYADDVRLPDGDEVHGYLHIETPGYAMVVPLDREGRIGLVRSYKRGVDAIDVQPPAGVLDPGEDPLDAARRELREELGCEAETWHALGAYALSGNWGAGLAHLYLAAGCEQVAEPEPGDLEEQQTLWLPVEDVRTAWRSSAFQQIGTAAALGLALDAIDRLRRVGAA